MTYEEALALVKTEYETFHDAAHCEIIRTGLTYDGLEGFCVCLYNEGDRVILTDMGETKEVFDEVTKEEWTALCTEAGFAFRHWHIEREFHSLDDVELFIAFLDAVSNLFWDVDDDE